MNKVFVLIWVSALFFSIGMVPLELAMAFTADFTLDEGVWN